MSGTPIASGFARVLAAQPALPRAHIVTVECDVVRGLHAFSLVGLPDKAIEESKDRIASAIKNAGFESPKRTNKKIVLSLAPANLKKEGSVFDLPLALAFLLASGQIKWDMTGRVFAGELALNGEVRPVSGVLSIAMVAKAHGATDVYVPFENAQEASLVTGIHVHAVRSLAHVLDELATPCPYIRHAHTCAPDDEAFDDIRGQESAKRALVIAGSGGHNVALYGPPGTGKTLLARALSSILPNLTEDEMLEVTAIHSIAGTLQGEAVVRPPFRSPHHTSSYASLIGGGSTHIKPGEATLAHRGVLFVDEFPEFHRDVIQALREPLEDGIVSIARAKGSATYPAHFILVAALNPCPCGFWGTSRCTCMPHSVEKYQRKISGPIADRIDMWIPVGEMPPERLTSSAVRNVGETQRARNTVLHARAVQRKRYANESIRSNAEMKPKDIEKYAQISSEAEKHLITAAHKLHLSARGYHRTIKLARTIADMVNEEHVLPEHMLEALQYRSKKL